MILIVYRVFSSLFYKDTTEIKYASNYNVKPSTKSPLIVWDRLARSLASLDYSSCLLLKIIVVCSSLTLQQTNKQGQQGYVMSSSQFFPMSKIHLWISV